MKKQQRIKVLHIITGLNQGGAESILSSLVLATLGDVHHTVVSMLDDGVYGGRLRDQGVRVEALNMKRGKVTLAPVLALRHILKTARPDVVQTWMYHANLLGGIVAKLTGCDNIIWGIHHSNLDSGRNKAVTIQIARFCALVSRWVPAAIACCSSEATRLHQSLGYRRDKFRIIPNGYDLACFRPDEVLRTRLRAEFGVGDNELLLGLVGRWDPQKDHANLFGALSHLAKGGMHFRCILVGSNMTNTNKGLLALIANTGLQEQIIMAGPRTDIPAIMNGLDIHVLSSMGEAFPNVVAESMACGTPCVTTNVGDAAIIVGNREWVAPPTNPAALAFCIRKVFADLQRDGRDFIGCRCRERIVANFSMERMVDSYKNLWAEVVSTNTGSSS
jgi:glycosyltransferase involved in cell wall biosynthesis